MFAASAAVFSSVPCFEHDAQHVAASEFLQNRAQIGAAVFSRQLDHFGTRFVQALCAWMTGWQRGHHEYIIPGAADNSRMQWQAQPRIQNYPQQQTPARKAGAIREQRIVSEDGSYAREQRVRGVAHALHLRTRFS